MARDLLKAVKANTQPISEEEFEALIKKRHAGSVENAYIEVCPVCMEGEVLKESYHKEFEYKGKVLSFKYEQDYCNKCGSLLQSTENIARNLESRNEAIKNSEIK